MNGKDYRPDNVQSQQQKKSTKQLTWNKKKSYKTRDEKDILVHG